MIHLIFKDGSHLELQDADVGDVQSGELILVDSIGQVVAIFPKDSILVFGRAEALRKFEVMAMDDELAEDESGSERHDSTRKQRQKE
jgi:hypothetical protein